MRTRIAVIADYASISMGDKLNVLGIFSSIFARSEPIVHLQMQLVLQFEFDASEWGKKSVQIALRDADGHDLMSVGGEIAVPHSPHGEPSVVNQILLLNNTTFPRFGYYEFQVLLNGHLEANIPLAVRKAEDATLVA